MNTAFRNEIFYQMDVLISKAILTHSNGHQVTAPADWQTHLDQTFLALKEKLGWTWKDRAELSKAHSDALDQMEKELMGMVN